MHKNFQKLIDKVLHSLDWDSILTIHQSFKSGIGQGSEVIPGLKRKNFDESLSKNDLKGELKILLKFVIDNNYQQYSYGHWVITWFNQEWQQEEIVEMQMEMQEDDEEIEFEIFSQDSKLEVIYAPQRICLTTNILSEEVQLAPQSDYSALQIMLDKALSQENYEIAQKLQEILQLTNNSSKVEDK
jgi:hypothetical protein